jgi:hypothetical protein
MALLCPLFYRAIKIAIYDPDRYDVFDKFVYVNEQSDANPLQYFRRAGRTYCPQSANRRIFLHRASDLQARQAGASKSSTERPGPKFQKMG